MISGDKSEKIYYVSSKNRIAAGLLCLLGLIGIAGIHRMYVGKWKTGILFSLTFGIFFIGTLYDICMIYCESFKDADGFPLFAPSSVKMILSILVDTLNSYKEDSYAAIGRAA